MLGIGNGLQHLVVLIRDGMGIESQNRNLGRIDAEIRLQRYGERRHLGHKEADVDLGQRFLQRHVVGGYGNAHDVVHHQAQCIGILEIGEQKILANLRHLVAIRSHHQGICMPAAHILKGFFHRNHRHLRREFGGRARLNLQFVFHDIDDVELAWTGLTHIAGQSVIGRIQTEILLVISECFRLAIQDGSQHFKHSGIGKGLQNDFITDAVEIAVGQCHTR